MLRTIAAEGPNASCSCRADSGAQDIKLALPKQKQLIKKKNVKAMDDHMQTLKSQRSSPKGDR